MTKPTITFDQLAALDIRMCKIISVTPILKNPKKELSDTNPIKAYHLIIDTGSDTLECVTNIVMFKPEDLLGLVTPFILNLAPTEIRGVLSKAMIVAPSLGSNIALLRTNSGDIQGWSVL